MFEALRRTLAKRNVIEEVTIQREDNKKFKFYGAVNKLFAKPMFGSDKQGYPTIAKVDAVLDARECNKHISINKGAIDYMRNHLPFLTKNQDMNNALFDMRVNNFTSFGKADMLNAFA